ncbi:hypothetical protein CPAR01_10450 [Colletotrichum paranaense]|uniref:Uncharacterized protein n=1 Tax=Colletotrichum paranaense TaxID=1914294 RepID=A0ABQ9SE15_9PEZI|nr:uncharacterized protein CPAR01_10450 [Colletotrichum paranaense]KAK1533742.1 hypothetical protein CPAR01_10450 [Colletotrichum paranaense]
MGFPSGIVVVLKRDWTPISRIRKRYEFDGSGRLFFPELIVLQKDAIAWLPRQESFRKAGDYREWVYIALYYPSLPVLLDANGSGSIHWDSLEGYEHPYDERLVEIPVSHLSAEVFILRDFVPRVPEYDALAARYPPGEVGIFLKGDIATHEDFSMHPPMILRPCESSASGGQRRQPGVASTTLTSKSVEPHSGPLLPYIQASTDLDRKAPPNFPHVTPYLHHLQWSTHRKKPS